MSRSSGAVAVALALVPALVLAAEPCDELALRCRRGYVMATLPGLLLPESGYRSSKFGPGMVTGLGGGLFRAVGRFGVAFGGRVGYGFLSRGDIPFLGSAHFGYLGPELRLGGAGRRVFGFAAIRGGGSYVGQKYVYYRSSLPEAIRGFFGYVGIGAGAWGLLGRRIALGGEVDYNILLPPVERHLELSLSIGLWL